MDWTALAEEQLSDAANKALTNEATRSMAAKGMVPLVHPLDMLSVLYQVANSSDPQPIRDTAKETATKLPEGVLSGGLKDPAADPRVLDFFSRLVPDEVLAVVIQNASTDPSTIAAIAASCSSSLVDLIATNEQRMLQYPDIIAGLYNNPKSRMSIADRAVELAIRNDVVVSGIMAWDELVAHYKGEKKQSASKTVEEKPMEDARFETLAEAMSDDGETSKEEIPLRDMTVPQKIRLAMLGNAFARSQLVRDTAKMVAMAAIKSPRVKDNEALKYANNHSLNDDVIRYISNRREWVKMYAMKVALINNPKTPLAAAMRLLPHLRPKDLKNIAKSRNVPSALSTGAKRLSAAKQGGAK